jgi:hypothetical protein
MGCCCEAVVMTSVSMPLTMPLELLMIRFGADVITFTDEMEGADEMMCCEQRECFLRGVDFMKLRFGRKLRGQNFFLKF